MEFLNKIPILLSLFIALLTIIISWTRNFTIVETIIRLIFQIPAFYAIGMILSNYINKNFNDAQQSRLDDSEPEENGLDEKQTEKEFEPIDFSKADI